jgi:hypothetical protein
MIVSFPDILMEGQRAVKMMDPRYAERRPEIESLFAAAPSSLAVLTSPLFLASLVLLAANDWIFKRLAPGLVTGKLSDLAGVFAFAVFWMAVFPRHRAAVAVIAGAAFASWKLPAVQPLLDAWNAHAPFRLGRTVDATDLIALAVLPLAFLYVRRDFPRPRRSATVAAIAVSSFLFVATSFRTTEEYSEIFYFAGDSAQLVSALEKLGIKVFGRETAGSEGGTAFSLSIPSDICFDSIEAYVLVMTRNGVTEVTLVELTHHCPKKGDDKAILYRAFHNAVVVPLALARRGESS